MFLHLWWMRKKETFVAFFVLLFVRSGSESLLACEIRLRATACFKLSKQCQ